MRPLLALLALLIIVLTLGASGLTSAIASTVPDDDVACCADGEGERRDEGLPADDGCPPLCDRCACSPTFALPRCELERIVAEARSDIADELSSQLPVGPPGRGVFHPPRRAA